MSFSPPTLHPDVIATDAQRDLARSRIEALVSRRPESGGNRVDDGLPVAILLTTVSTDGASTPTSSCGVRFRGRSEWSSRISSSTQAMPR